MNSDLRQEQANEKERTKKKREKNKETEEQRSRETESRQSYRTNKEINKPNILRLSQYRATIPALNIF